MALFERCDVGLRLVVVLDELVDLALVRGGGDLEIGFNAKYLLEIANQVDRENAVFMFNSSGDPTLMREGNDASAVYVVMPMRV